MTQHSVLSDEKIVELIEHSDGSEHSEFEFARAVEAEVLATPIDMVLHCPRCHTQHVDAPEPSVEHDHGTVEFAAWDNPPHKSHLCHACGCIWRPADVPTNGVMAVKTRGKADNYPVEVTHG